MKGSWVRVRASALEDAQRVKARGRRTRYPVRAHRHDLPVLSGCDGPVEAPAMRSRAIAAGLHRLGHRVSVIVGMAEGREPAPVDGVEIVATSWPELRRLRAVHGLRLPQAVEPGEPARIPLVRSFVSSVMPERYGVWVAGSGRDRSKDRGPGRPLSEYQRTVGPHRGPARARLPALDRRCERSLGIQPHGDETSRARRDRMVDGAVDDRPRDPDHDHEPPTNEEMGAAMACLRRS